MSFCHFNSHYWPAERESESERRRETDVTPELSVSGSIRLATAQKFILPDSSIFSSSLLFNFTFGSALISLFLSISISVSTYKDTVVKKKLN